MRCSMRYGKPEKKVRYLLEFFETLLEKKQRKSTKKLVLLQKRFGALNDVVASRELLQSNLGSILDERTARRTIHLLKNEKNRGPESLRRCYDDCLWKRVH